eukprot:scaffold113334_cov62-Phaeocystis_antarctica.AAC.3
MTSLPIGISGIDTSQPFDRKALLGLETRVRRTRRETSDCNSRALCTRPARLGRRSSQARLPKAFSTSGSRVDEFSLCRPVCAGGGRPASPNLLAPAGPPRTAVSPPPACPWPSAAATPVADRAQRAVAQRLPPRL